MSNVFSCTGTIGRDAEVRYLPSGQEVLNVSVANNVGFGDRQQTVWLRVVVWGKRAEGNLKDYLKKGQQVFVSGELTMSEYKANDGSTKSSLELNATILDLVGKRNESSAPAPMQSGQYNAPAPASNYAPQSYQNNAPQPAQHYSPQPVANKPADSFNAPYDDDIPF
jgi:single-strand DNA-binding protein